ncbi:probable BOI-related E3 ubiquitin-protein ligase 2 [Humulus lupulus]|uniref:probable BOI-related E3 ubiquitin-protein ligase 2 n=1 Tax=Humulus lupulus TaxID=3486 RepID=UPI002B40E1B9|nr:probable BOI-related E3 ubiquitin-protein ligase 2 [Humulus lupulus]
MAAHGNFCSGNMGWSSPVCAVQDWSVNPLPLGVEDDQGFCFGLQNVQQQQQQLLLPQFQPLLEPQNYSAGFFDSNSSHGVYASSSSSSSSLSSSDMFFQMAMDAQFELHKQELDFFLQSQNEKLRMFLHEQRKQQFSVLMSSFESKMMSLIRQKEEDMVRAKIKSVELQDQLKSAEIENQTWQRVARGTEATVIDLRNALAYFKGRNRALTSKNSNNNNNLVEDVESCCESRVEKIHPKMVCQSCKTQSSCVLFFPCRHLCSCKYCEAILEACPVCESAKEAAMEVFFG